MAFKAAIKIVPNADAYTCKDISSEQKTNLDGTQRKSKDSTLQRSIHILRVAVESGMKDMISATVLSPSLPDFTSFLTFENTIGGMLNIHEVGNRGSDAALRFNAESVASAGSEHAPRKAE